MASVIQPNIYTPVYNEDNPGAGTSYVSVLHCRQIKSNKMAFVSARIKVEHDILTQGMDALILTLNRFVPAIEGQMPSVITIITPTSANTFSGLARIYKHQSGTYYLQQRVTSNLEAGNNIEIFVCYPTKD